MGKPSMMKNDEQDEHEHAELRRRLSMVQCRGACWSSARCAGRCRGGPSRRASASALLRGRGEDRLLHLLHVGEALAATRRCGCSCQQRTTSTSALQQQQHADQRDQELERPDHRAGRAMKACCARSARRLRRRSVQPEIDAARGCRGRRTGRRAPGRWPPAAAAASCGRGSRRARGRCGRARRRPPS